MPKVKQKTSWRHVHKIKVHENRWLAWAISLALLACAALVAYIQVTNINFETQMADSAYTASSSSLFTNKSEGYTIRYPKNWSLETDGENSISFVNSSNYNEYFNITVYDSSEERTVRQSLFQTEEEDVSINGLSGVKISQGRNQPESVVMIENDDRLYVFRGRGDIFERIIRTFKFQQKLE